MYDPGCKWSFVRPKIYLSTLKLKVSNSHVSWQSAVDNGSAVTEEYISSEIFRSKKLNSQRLKVFF